MFFVRVVSDPEVDSRPLPKFGSVDFPPRKIADFRILLGNGELWPLSPGFFLGC